MISLSVCHILYFLPTFGIFNLTVGLRPASIFGFGVCCSYASVSSFVNGVEASSQYWEWIRLRPPLDPLDIVLDKFCNRILDTFKDASTGTCLVPVDFNVMLLFVLGVALALSNLSS